MGTPRVRTDAPLSRRLASTDILASDPFGLVDVGASGGIEQHWRLFEPHLRGFGFEPVVKECGRLNREEKNPNIRYVEAFLGAEGYRELFPAGIRKDPLQGWSNQAFTRTSAARAVKLGAMTQLQRINNDRNVVFTETRTSLDAFLAGHPGESVDFIKIDTDGHDYEVLCGADRTIRERNVLGLFVECQFHGITHAHSNLFSNIDRYLRERGFSLFDLEVYRYTRGVLPGRFVVGIPAQTQEGQVQWADALYLRDVCASRYAERFPPPLSPAKLLKLACLFEIFGMPDCAAELLLQSKDMLGDLIDVPAALDLLAQEIDPKAGGFEQLNARFQRGPEAFCLKPRGAGIRDYMPPRMRTALSAVKRRLLGYLRRS